MSGLLTAGIGAAAAMLGCSQGASAQALLPSPNGEVALVDTFEVKPGKEAEFEGVFRQVVTCSRLEPGNVVFNLHKVLGAEHSYILYEVWRSEDAVRSHAARPYTVRLFDMFGRNLTRPVTEGSLHFVQDLDPLPRAPAAATDPASLAACR